MVPPCRKKREEPGASEKIVLLAHSSCLALGLHWIAGVSPGIEASLQCPDMLVAPLQKLLRQTGAGSFLGSSAIGNPWLVLGDER